MINKKDLKDLKFELININDQKIKEIFEQLSDNLLKGDLILSKLTLNKLIKQINDK